MRATGGGAHGVLVTAVSPVAFSQALSMIRRKGTVALVGLPPGAFPTPIFDDVLKRITIRGSIVGTRQDLDEAIAFAAEGKVGAHVETTTPKSKHGWCLIWPSSTIGKAVGRVARTRTPSVGRRSLEGPTRGLSPAGLGLTCPEPLQKTVGTRERTPEPIAPHKDVLRTEANRQ